jgi:hypothetical protein
MPLTDRDAQALTYLAMRLRQETHGAGPWDEHGTHAVVAKLVGRNLAVSVEQVTRHAADPEAKTPGAIMRPFTPAAPTEHRDRPLPPKRGQDCPHHPGQHATNCGGCRADQLAGPGYDDERAAVPPRSWDPGDPATGAAACRAAMREVEA